MGHVKTYMLLDSNDFFDLKKLIKGEWKKLKNKVLLFEAECKDRFE